MLQRQLLAILTSDWHFSQNAPTARSAEPDWFAAQKRPIQQLKAIQADHGGDVPIVVAGDLFDKWHAPSTTPELINFLLTELPDHIYAIPGQHDLPYHRYDERHRSPYGTLVYAGKIHDLLPRVVEHVPGLQMYAFPWGVDVVPLEKGLQTTRDIHLAVAHSYIWRVGFSYPGADKLKHADYYKGCLVGYDAAVFGDNHKGFMVGSSIINTGTLMRRATDERTYKPQVGLLWSDGKVEPHYLDVSEDRWLVDDDVSSGIADVGASFDATKFVDSLQSLGPDSLDFRRAITHRMDTAHVRDSVRKVVLEVVQ